jgi:hypothetical protein
MSVRRLLIGLLLLATVLVDCALVKTVGPFPLTLHPTRLFAWTLQLSQVSLMAIWLALGRTSGPLRLMGTVMVVALWSWALADYAPRDVHLKVSAIDLTALTVAVSVPLLVARWLGLRLVDVSSAPEAEDLAGGSRRFQFSIAYLLGWITALALMLGMLQYVTPFWNLQMGRHNALWALSVEWRGAVFRIGHAALAWSALWAVLGKRRPVVRILTLCAVGGTAVITTFLANPRFAGGIACVLALFSLEALLLISPLVVFRVAGYRLRVRRGKWKQGGTPGGCVRGDSDQS